MEHNENLSSPWSPPEWDGQDGSQPEPRREPDEIDRFLHPEPFESDEAQAGPDPSATPPPASAAETSPPAAAPSPAAAHGTGLYYRDGSEIPPTHPDHGPMHLLPRQEDGRIAAYYYCSKAELYDAEVPDPPPRRCRRDGFSPERQEQFLELIRGGASGREAARRIHISATTAYNLYNSPDGAAFRQAWDEAAKVTDIVLEDTAFDRAVNGQEEIVYHQGQRVGVRWKYDNNLLMKLLRARNPLKCAPLSEIEGWLRHRGLAAPADVDGALDRLRTAEAEWGRRLAGEESPARQAENSVRPELVEGPSSPSPAQNEDGPSTGSGRTEASADDPLVESTSSTSSGSGRSTDGDARSLPPASAPDEPPAQSTSSTSSGSGQQGEADAPSISTASAAEEPPVGPASPPIPSSAEAPDDSVIFYRPPPRPRLISS